MIEKLAKCPENCKNQVLGIKKGSGRPAKSVLALLRQPRSSIMVPIEGSEELDSTLTEAPDSEPVFINNSTSISGVNVITYISIVLSKSIVMMVHMDSTGAQSNTYDCAHRSGFPEYYTLKKTTTATTTINSTTASNIANTTTCAFCNVEYNESAMAEHLEI